MNFEKNQQAQRVPTIDTFINELPSQYSPGETMFIPRSIEIVYNQLHQQHAALREQATQEFDEGKFTAAEQNSLRESFERQAVLIAREIYDVESQMYEIMDEAAARRSK